MKIVRALLTLGIIAAQIYRVRVMQSFAAPLPEADEARPVHDPRPLSVIVAEQNAYLARQI